MNLPIITVFCPITRPRYLERWFADLYSTDLVPENTNLVFIIDGEYPKAYDIIMQEMEAVKWRKFLIARNYDHEVAEGSIPLRRKRIAEIHEQAKPLIESTDGKFVLGLEDDTVFTNLSVAALFLPFSEEMLKIYNHDMRAGLVTAYQAGRWSQKMLGVWRFDNPLEPTVCSTCLPGMGTEDIDAAGFYCYLTPTFLFLQHTYSTEEWQPWGPDVNYGLYLRKMGFNNYVNWEQPVGHRDDTCIISPNGNLLVERFEKTELGWERKKQ